MILLFIYLLMIMAIALILWGILYSGGFGKRRLKLPGEETQRIKKFKMRTYLSAIFPFTGKFLERFKLDMKLKDRLDAAHVRFAAGEFFNLKLLGMLGLGVLAVLAWGEFNLPAVLVAVALGYVVPDLWLRRKLARRKYAISRLVPEVVDLLSLCVEAGLDFTTAVRWVIDKIPSNPMIEELAFLLEEIKWGKSRVQALRDMSRRLSVPEVSSFVQTLVQAERMGTPVAEAFAILSEDTRMRRFHHGERTAMMAPIKILIPLIFCILPVIAIVIGGPIFLQFTQGGLLQGLGK